MGTPRAISINRIAATAGNNQKKMRNLANNDYTFKSIKQVQGHSYTYDISTDSKNVTTYSLMDSTAGGPVEIATKTDIQRAVSIGDEFHNPTTNPIKRFEFTPGSTGSSFRA